MEFLSTRQVSAKWNITQRQVIELCLEGRVPGAQKVDTHWIVPEDAEKPEDGRSLRYCGTTAKIKPFLKWAGGKGQLLPEIRKIYPEELGRSITKYAEPFVGGGAVLLDLLGSCQLEEVYISDSNAELVNAYGVIRDRPDDLSERLYRMQEAYLALDMEGRKEYYYAVRDRFNPLKTGGGGALPRAADMIFLNRTCFNGLYRVNKKGLFNVPMGAYRNPQILDADNLALLSGALRRVRIVHGDYRRAEEFIDDRTFAYFDPPYRPLTRTSAFTSYTENAFGDEEQRRLAEFVLHLAREKGARVAASNSDPHNADPADDFFEEIYDGCVLRRIDATRMINANTGGRGKIKELLITTW